MQNIQDDEQIDATIDATEDRKRGYVRALVRRLRLAGVCSWCAPAIEDAILRTASDRLYFLEPDAEGEVEPTDEDWTAFADGLKAGYELASNIALGGYRPLNTER